MPDIDPARDDDWFEDDEPEDIEDFDDCSMMPDGLCMQAGSEWCDWSCPVMAMHARERIRKMKKKNQGELDV